MYRNSGGAIPSLAGLSYRIWYTPVPPSMRTKIVLRVKEKLQGIRLHRHNLVRAINRE